MAGAKKKPEETTTEPSSSPPATTIRGVAPPPPQTIHHPDLGAEESPPGESPEVAALVSPPPVRTRSEARAAAPVSEATHATYRVWEHGPLHRDGKTFAAGDELVLPIAVGDEIVCLRRVSK